MTDIFIDRDSFNVWKESYYPKTKRGVSVVTSMYSPYLLDDSEAESNGEWTAAVTLGLFVNNSPKKKCPTFGKVCAILFSLFPAQILSPNKVVAHAKNLGFNYLNNSDIRTNDGWQPDMFLVPGEEGQNNNLIAEIKAKNGDVPVKRFLYKDYGKTLDNIVKRAMMKISEKRIFVAAHPTNKGELRNMDEGFIHQVTSYPILESRATMWALCQAIVYMESNSMFETENNVLHLRGIEKPFYGP
jgi:hypothetical protein